MNSDEYIEEYVKTGHFSFGHPRSFKVTPDGKSLLFLRSEGAKDPIHKLYELNLETGKEKLLIDTTTLHEAKTSELSEAELRLRERLREIAGGISHYSSDAGVSKILCMAGSVALLYDRTTLRLQTLKLEEGAHLAQISPDGNKIAYIKNSALWVRDVVSQKDLQITPEESDPGIEWGVAEFIAAEEMHRFNGFWWSPKSDKLLVARIDESDVSEVQISDPTNPLATSSTMRYPLAGTVNARVGLHLFSSEGSVVTQLSWDEDTYEYVSRVSWSDQGILVKVITRDQKNATILHYDHNGNVSNTSKQSHPKWLKTSPDVVTFWGEKLLTLDFINGVRTLCIDSQPGTANLNVQGISGINNGVLYFHANDPNVPEERQLYSLDSDQHLTQITKGETYHTALVENGVLILHSARKHEAGRETEATQLATNKKQIVHSNAAIPSSRVMLNFHRLGKKKLSSAILLPHNYKKLKSIPIIMSPYGGPFHQEVVFARDSFNQEQWFAMNGYAVVLCDGRGTPNRTEAWEYSIENNLADPILEDQVAALEEIVKLYPMLDIQNVGIRGWSFGGFLAALALLDKPDLFKAAVSGAPVTDWRNYDTFYTEQFLDDPKTNKAAYDRSSVLPKAPALSRPLMLIHGMTDDNVLVVNSLQLADAIFKAKKSSYLNLVLLSNHTHIPSDVDSTICLLKNELEFFNRHLKN